MEQEDFEKLVKQAIDDLPEKIRQKMENVVIIVEERPTEEQLRKAGVRFGTLLLGLYEGIPKTVWGRGFGGNLPDKITIFQEIIERVARSEEEAKRTSSLLHLHPATRESVIKEMVKYVVWHEVAHHFGFSEKGVKLLGEKRKKRQNKT